MKIIGRVKIELNGKLIREGENLVVTTGKNRFAAIAAGTSTDLPTKLQIGTGSTPPTVADTALVAGSTSGAATVSVSGNELTLTKVFAAAVGTFCEFGVFNTALDLLFARFITLPFTSTSSDTFTVTWTLQFGD